MASSCPSRGSVTFGALLSSAPRGRKVLLLAVHITGWSGTGTSSMISSPFGTACNAVAVAASRTTSARERIESRSGGSVDCTAAAKNARASSRLSASSTSLFLSELHHSRTWSTSFWRPAINRACVSSGNSPVQFCHHASRSSQPEGGNSPAFGANQAATAGASSNQALRSEASSTRTAAQGPCCSRSRLHSWPSDQSRGVTKVKVAVGGSRPRGSRVRLSKSPLALDRGRFAVPNSHPDRPAGT